MELNEEEKKIVKQFKNELFRPNLNVAELDGIACAKCGIVPFIQKKRVKGKWIVDRSSRIDCDGGEGKEKLETYHVECWRKLASEREEKTTP